MLWESVVEKCCEVLWRSVVELCCRGVLQRSDWEKLCKEALGEKCCREVL